MKGNGIWILGMVIYVVGLMLKLPLWGYAVLTGILLSVAIAFRKGRKRAKENGERFYQADRYMETVLGSYGRSGKIDDALSASYEAMPEGKMRQTLARAKLEMTMAGEEFAYGRALAVIEEAYPSDLLHKVNQFMVHGELYGGDLRRPVELLQLERQHQLARIQENMQDRKKAFRNILLSILMSLVVCAMVLYLPAADVDVADHFIVQVVALVVVALDGLILLGGQRYLSADWLALASPTDQVDYVEKYAKYREYGSRIHGSGGMWLKKRKTNLRKNMKGHWKGCLFNMMGIAVCISFCVFLVMKGHLWYALFPMLLGMLLVNYEMLVYGVIRKQLVRRMRRDFPCWLLDIALLLQSENVHMAIEKSYENAPDILKPDLRKLLARLEVNPESFAPFGAFCSDLDIPEIHTCMSGLFAISMGEDGTKGEKLQELVASCHVMLDYAERERLKDENSGMYLLFLAPVLTASGKMVVDMMMFMLAFLGSVSL